MTDHLTRLNITVKPEWKDDTGREGLQVAKSLATGAMLGTDTYPEVPINDFDIDEATYNKLDKKSKTILHEAANKVLESEDSTNKEKTMAKRFIRNNLFPADSATIWTDGGCKPNPGVGSWGFYAELDNGKSWAGCGLAGSHVSNNAAELKAVEKAIEYSINNELNDLLIYSDSKYVINGVNNLSKWKSSGWTKHTGEPLSNLEFWKSYDEVNNKWNALENTTPVKYKWVKGHSGVHGNEMADQFATRGRIQYLNGFTNNYFVDPTAKPVENIEPLSNLISGRRWYFKTNHDAKVGDVYVYPTLSFEEAKGEAGKDAGKRASDSHYCITLLKRPIETLERLKQHFNNQLQTAIAPVLADVDLIRSSSTWPTLVETKHRFTEMRGTIAVLPSGVGIANVVRPPRQVYKLDDIFNGMIKVLSDINDPTSKRPLVVKDITDEFIKVDKKGKQSITPTFTNKEKSVTIKDVELPNGTKISPIINIGIDFPIRNRLSGLLKVDPLTPVSIKLALWDIDANSYRLGTIISQGEEESFYMTTDSSHRFIVDS